jgi:hypothetical protein
MDFTVGVFVVWWYVVSCSGDKVVIRNQVFEMERLFIAFKNLTMVEKSREFLKNY